MTFTSMDYFLQLAKTRSFTKAAEQLFITQQSLSAHIAALEQELGCQLFVRRVPLELTYAGEVFYKYALEFQQKSSDMQQEMCDISLNKKGVLRVGVAFTRGRAVMPQLIQAFQQQYPDIIIELHEASNEALHKKLINREIDLAIANFSDGLAGVELEHFYTEDVQMFVSRQYLQNTYGEKCDEMCSRMHHGDFSVMDAGCFVVGDDEDIAAQIGNKLLRKARISPVIKAKSSNVETLLNLCAIGVGACFCPYNVASTFFSPDQMENIMHFSLGDTGECKISFGYVNRAYQWKIISEFIRISLQTVKNG